MDAFRSGRVVAITDLQTERDRWPEYCAVAERLGMVSVAGIPMRLSGTPSERSTCMAPVRETGPRTTSRRRR